MTDEVIRRHKAEEIFARIEQIRQECLRSNKIIQKTDHGYSTNSNPFRVYPITLRKIARTSLTPPRIARRLFRLARFMKATKILEIGTSLGITTAYFALARPDARIITLEGCPELSRIAREHFNRLGIKNIELLEGRFEENLSKALNLLETADIVYIDGNHQKEALLNYYKQCYDHSVNDTVIVIDDIHSSPGMEEAWEEIWQKEEARVSLDLFTSGWVLFRKESSKQHFRLRYV
jgi:predicted O-methyltransferase YrrM